MWMQFHNVIWFTSQKQYKKLMQFLTMNKTPLNEDRHHWMKTDLKDALSSRNFDTNCSYKSKHGSTSNPNVQAVGRSSLFTPNADPLNTLTLPPWCQCTSQCCQHYRDWNLRPPRSYMQKPALGIHPQKINTPLYSKVRTPGHAATPPLLLHP